MKKVILLILVVFMICSCWLSDDMYVESVELANEGFSAKYRVEIKTDIGTITLFTNKEYNIGDKVAIVKVEGE